MHLLGAGKDVQPQDSAHHGMNRRTNGPKGVPKTGSVIRFRQKDLTVLSTSVSEGVKMFDSDGRATQASWIYPR